MIKKLGRTALATAATAVLLTGSAGLFAGTALATDNDGHHHRHHHGTEGEAGTGGTGGNAASNCLIPLGISAGIVGQGGSNTQCDAHAGQGGEGGDGIHY
jgi:hypothetical protein